MSSYPPPPPPPPRAAGSLTNKIFTFAAIGMGVGLGTCTIASVASGSEGNVAGVFVWIGASLFYLSFAVILLTAVFVIVRFFFK